MRPGMKSELVCLVLVLLLDGFRAEEVHQTQECVAVHPSGTRFMLTSAQNLTGHWTTQFQLQHESVEAGLEEPDLGTWEADVQQNTLSCENRRKIIIIATITAPPPKPGPGYDLIPGHGYYKVHVEHTTWEDARRTCNQEGAHLIIINSEAEAKLAKDLSSRYSNIGKYVYVGLHDIYTEGQFRSVLGVPIPSVGYANWKKNEPNNDHGGEDCVELILEDLTYNDVRCSETHPYICEQEM